MSSFSNTVSFPNAISTQSGGGRWIIWASDITDTNTFMPGTLAYDFTRHGATGPADWAADPGNGYVSAATQQAFLSGSVQNKTYDGTRDAQVSALSVSTSLGTGLIGAGASVLFDSKDAGYGNVNLVDPERRQLCGRQQQADLRPDAARHLRADQSGVADDRAERRRQGLRPRHGGHDQCRHDHRPGPWRDADHQHQRQLRRQERRPGQTGCGLRLDRRRAQRRTGQQLQLQQQCQQPDGQHHAGAAERHRPRGAQQGLRPHGGGHAERHAAGHAAGRRRRDDHRHGARQLRHAQRRHRQDGDGDRPGDQRLRTRATTASPSRRR